MNTKTKTGITASKSNGPSAAKPRMQVKTKVKSLAIIASNHNEALVRA